MKIDEELVLAWLQGRIAEMLGIAAEEIDCAAPFADAGLSSIQAVEVAGELERWAGLMLSPTLAFDYPTVDAVAAHVVEQAALVRDGGGASPAVTATGVGG